MPSSPASTWPSTASPRGSASPGKGIRCLHLVNAWAVEANLCLGIVACDADANEITVIQQLLALLELQGALVSIDAAGSQQKIAAQIVAAGGEYLLAGKGNQEKLYEEVKAFFKRQLGNGARLFPQEGGPAIPEIDVPNVIIDLAVRPGGEVWFGPGFGLEELLAEWPGIPKRVYTP